MLHGSGFASSLLAPKACLMVCLAPESLYKDTPIAALIYDEGTYPDRVLQDFVRDLKAQAFVLGGVIQQDVPRAGAARCDMFLENLGTGELIRISEYRGEGARGCRLDHNGLLAAASGILTSVENHAVDMLIINKFGKIEAEGGGLRQGLAAALERSIPILIGVPRRNQEAWQAFAGDFAVALAPTLEDLNTWAKAHLPRLQPKRHSEVSATRLEFA